MLLLVGDQSYGKVLEDFMRITTDINLVHTCPEKIQLLFFTGGEDVSPFLYNHPNLASYSNLNRDKLEFKLAAKALQYKIPMIGVCRGFQFLNVLAGGYMIQHVTNHSRPHLIFSFEMEEFKASSTHHQMVFPPDDSFIMAFSEPLSDTFVAYGDEVPPLEIESAYFPNINAFGVQWHPEIDLVFDRLEAVNFFRRNVSHLLAGTLRGKVEDYNIPRFKTLCGETRCLYQRRSF